MSGTVVTGKSTIDPGYLDEAGTRTEGALEDRCPIVPTSSSPIPLNPDETELIRTIVRLQFFLATAPTYWTSLLEPVRLAPSIRKFTLPNGENVSCVLWHGLYHITGTDIVRVLAFRFEAFGRPVQAAKKWEEGVFSDLRNLKPGVDATLEEPKSPLLEYLFRNGCIRTQKKQKVFYWFSVPHDRLFLDALERDLKREKGGLAPATVVKGEPALSFRYDPRRTLYDQFAGQNPGLAASLSERRPRPSSASPPFITAKVNVPHAESPDDEIEPLAAEAQSSDWIDRQDQATPMPFKCSVLPGSIDHKKRKVGYRWRTGTMARRETVKQELFEHPRAWTSPPQYTAFSVDQSNSQNVNIGANITNAQAHSRMTPPFAARAYQCFAIDCAKRFRRLEHLKRHMRMHTKERPFVCGECKRQFSRQDNLSQHEKTHENPPKQSRQEAFPHDPCSIHDAAVDLPQGSSTSDLPGLDGGRLLATNLIDFDKVLNTHLVSDTSFPQRSLTEPPDWFAPPADSFAMATYTTPPVQAAPLLPNNAHRSHFTTDYLSLGPSPYGPMFPIGRDSHVNVTVGAHDLPLETSSQQGLYISSLYPQTAPTLPIGRPLAYDETIV